MYVPLSLSKGFVIIKALWLFNRLSEDVVFKSTRPLKLPCKNVIVEKMNSVIYKKYLPKQKELSLKESIGKLRLNYVAI